MTALGKTSPAEARAAQATTVRDIATGEVIARTNYQFLMPWGTEIWATDAIADHFDRKSCDVKTEDTDEGRFYSIDSKPVAYVEGEFDLADELLQIAAE